MRFRYSGAGCYRDYHGAKQNMKLSRIVSIGAVYTEKLHHLHTFDAVPRTLSIIGRTVPKWAQPWSPAC